MVAGGSLVAPVPAVPFRPCPSMTSLQRTPLHAAAAAAGGRLVPFAGWEMAVQFSGLVAEHQAVRRACGVFDISHMGVLALRGDSAKDALQGLVPSDLFRIGPGEACYTVLAQRAGRHPRRPDRLRPGLVRGRRQRRGEP